MLGEQSQLIVLFVLALAVHAALLYKVFQLTPAERARGDGTAAVERKQPGPGEASTIECPSCGAVNEAGYRYCRSCLGELPGWTIFQRERRNSMVPRGRG